MTDNFDLSEAFAGLEPAETRELVEKIRAAVREHVAAKQAQRQTEEKDTLREKYFAELQEITMTQRGDWKLRSITDLQMRYRAKGLDV